MKTLEQHEAEMPNCQDPDCEFHRAPVTPTITLERDCDLCKEAKVKAAAVYDAKTIWGPWAYLCQYHFENKANHDFDSVATKLSEVPA